MSHEHVESTSQAVTVGEEYEVRIIHLTMERRQMNLSIKQAELDLQPAPEPEVADVGISAGRDEESNMDDE